MISMKAGFTGQSEDIEELRARFTVRNAAVGGVVAVALPVAIYVDVRYLCNGRVWLNVARQNARSARHIACGSVGDHRACSVPFNLWNKRNKSVFNLLCGSKLLACAACAGRPTGRRRAACR